MARDHRCPDIIKLARSLSSPQRVLLLEAMPAACAEHYAPARKLIALGLAAPLEGRFGGYAVQLTDLGKAVRSHVDLSASAAVS